MKTIGLLGGMSWESTLVYYKLINEEIKLRLGGLNSAKIMLYSVNFDEIERLLQKEDWKSIEKVLTESARNIELSADCLLLCTNTMHMVADQIESNLKIPFLNIADATAEKIIDQGFKTVGLLGTQFTMEQDFYKGRLKDKYNLKVLIPELELRKIIHKIIFQELCKGIIDPQSRDSFIKIIDDLVQQGAEAIILGCTEFTLLINQEQTPIPILDTTVLHAKKAVNWVLT